MRAEVTKEFFNSIVKEDTPATAVNNTERKRETFYKCNDVRVVSVESFAAGVMQYYIIDINA